MGVQDPGLHHFGRVTVPMLSTLKAGSSRGGALVGRKQNSSSFPWRDPVVSHAAFAPVAGAVAAGGDFTDVVPLAYRAYEGSQTPVGEVLRSGGRVPFPLRENEYAWPLTPETPYPSNHLFPLPLPEVSHVRGRGRSRARAQHRNLQLMLLSLAVSRVNLLFAKGSARRATPPKGVPGSAAQYRCLHHMYLRIQSFLCRVESPGPGDPATGFSSGKIA